jgi:alkylation response protein AidB-like acyl-CoA dehydrogenase
MRSLDQARHVCENYLPGLIDGLDRIPFAQREAPGGGVLPVFRASRGPALVIPRDYGGLGATPLDAVRVVRAVGAYAPSLAVATTMHHFSVATLFGAAESMRKSGMEWALLEAIAGRNLLVASGFAEGRPNQGILHPTMVATPTTGGYLVNGAKKPCSLTHSMDLLTASVSLQQPGRSPETAFLLAPANLPGISRHPFWASNVLAGAESDEVRLTDVLVEEELVVRTETAADGALDELQTLGFIWFELLISASYLGMASSLVERTFTGRRGAPSERASLGARLETATLLLEGAARAVMAGETDNDALATVLLSRYGAQDAIGDAVRQAVELLGGMAFIGGNEVAYLSAACQCLAFHPPSRGSLAEPLVEYLDGAAPLLLGGAPATAVAPAEAATPGSATVLPAVVATAPPAATIPPVAPEPATPAAAAAVPVAATPGAAATAPTAPVVSAAEAADWDRGASLLEGAEALRLTARDCDLRYWFTNVPQRTLRGNVLGYGAEVVTPDFLREPGPLNEALKQEVAFRALAEERAARAIGYVMACAPDTATMEFYATQIMDETRHAMIFRNHLIDLGVNEKDVPEAIEQLAGRDRETILNPLEELGLPIVRDRHDFIGGVVLLTVLVEGFLAPSFELSERKWRPLDPVMADMEKGAGIDEVRHLAVGSSIIREHLAEHPEEKPRLLELVRGGMSMWSALPVVEQLGRWEALFQAGMVQHAALIGDYEVWPGRRLVDTTPQERIQKTLELTGSVHATRLTDMGLGEALA